MLIPPHGNTLVQRVAEGAERERLRAEARALPALTADLDTLLDLENLATGAFSPLEGFMDREALWAVAETLRLPGGPVWPLPVLFQRRQRPRVAVGEAAAIRDASGRVLGLLEVTEVYRLDLERLARRVWGTDAPRHPGVALLYRKGPWAVAGRVTLLEPVPHAYRAWSRSPAEVRAEFARRGFATVVAFQTRNAPHRAHEYLHRLGLELADGLLIHPILGRKKPGDFDTRTILEAYRVLVERVYPPGRVVLAGLATAMRYAGPREAVFHAIVRQNFGATHFIVGRDHAGVGDYYDPFAAHRIFDELPEPLGIRILKVGAVFHCAACGGIASERTCGHDPRARTPISMTTVRRLLREGRRPPPELVRPEVAEVLRVPPPDPRP